MNLFNLNIVQFDFVKIGQNLNPELSRNETRTFNINHK